MHDVARSIDLNADLGEGLGADEALLGIVTSANVACGFHAGDVATMRAACTGAVERRVAIGAHVSYRDRDGFGRRELGLAASTVGAEVTEQILALAAIAATVGGSVAYVKPHGALYHRAAVDAECAGAIVSAIGASGGSLAVLALPGSQLLVRDAHGRARCGAGGIRRPRVRARTARSSRAARPVPCSTRTAPWLRRCRLHAMARPGAIDLCPRRHARCGRDRAPRAAGLEDAGIDVRSFA